MQRALAEDKHETTQIAGYLLPPIPSLGELDVPVYKLPDGSLGLNVQQIPLTGQVERL